MDFIKIKGHALSYVYYHGITHDGGCQMKEFSPNNLGKLCYLRLIQGRHDGLILPEVRGQNKSQLVCLEPGVNKHDFPEAVRC